MVRGDVARMGSGVAGVYVLLQPQKVLADGASDQVSLIDQTMPSVKPSCPCFILKAYSNNSIQNGISLFALTTLTKTMPQSHLLWQGPSHPEAMSHVASVIYSMGTWSHST
jgi:hypothetical protein